MKKVLAICLLGISCLASSTMAANIGIYDDLSGTLCSGDFTLYVAKDFYFVAHLAPNDSLTACEFNASMNPIYDADSDPFVNQSFNFSGADLIIGGNPFDLTTETGFALSWTTPQAGPSVLLGNMSWFIFNEAHGIPENLHFCVIGSNARDEVLLVNEEFVEESVDGWCYRFLCGPPFTCTCDAVPVDAKNWGEIKALY